MKTNPLDSLTPERRAALDVLCISIDKIIETIPDDRGAMVRLSTRSPKDAVLTLPKVKKVIKEELESRPHSDSNSTECFIDDR
jgi:hypothetical protein